MTSIINTQGATSAVLIPHYKSCQRTQGDLSWSELSAVSLAHKKKTMEEWGARFAKFRETEFLTYTSLGEGPPKDQPLTLLWNNFDRKVLF